MTVAELLNNLALRSGIGTENPQLKSLVDSIGNTTIEADIADKVSNYLKGTITMEAAKNSPELKSHFVAQAYNGIDNTLKTTLSELGLGEEAIQGIYADKSTGKAVSNALKKIKELEAEKIGATKGEKSDLTDKINALNKTIADLTTGFNTEKDKLSSTHSAEIADLLMENVLGSYKYANEMSVDANLITAKTLLQRELADKKLKLVTDNRKLKLVTTDDTDFFENNKKVEFKEFVDSTVAKHKLIQTSEGGSQKTTTTTVQATPPNSFAEAAAKHAEAASKLYND